MKVEIQGSPAHIAEAINMLTLDNGQAVIREAEGKATGRRVFIYGPLPISGEAVEEILKHIPLDAEYAIIQAPPRRALDLRPCQRPGVLEMSASVDNSRFIHLSQLTTTAPYVVKVT